MMNFLNAATNILAHIVELVPMVISVLTAVGDMAQKLADSLKSFGATK